MKAVETTGVIEKRNRLILDDPLPQDGKGRVRVIVLYPEDHEDDEKQWLKAATSSPSFEFLDHTAEDIYKPTDGKPFNH